MKKSVITSVLAVLAALTTTVGAQNYPKEYLGLPGDNLNLYAVMDLFRNSPTLEAFERSLNDRDSRINNLDLNGDWRVDYIAVSDYRDGRVHNIVLRAVLGRNEYQDVAVIVVERLKKKRVVIQIIGDELLYGRNYIIEPVYAKSHRIRHDYSPVYYGGVNVYNNYYYDIWDWPVVVHIYSPYYDGWSSSWYWGYYPTWYEPWSPWYWDYYYGYHSGWDNHYHNYYHHSDHYRYNRYNDFYYHSVRQESPQVQRRITEGNYRQTYSRPDTRKDGEALYNSTQGRRSAGSQPAAVGSDRRSSAATSGRSAGSQPASVGTDRRSSAATGSRPAGNETGTVREGTGQTSQTRRAATTQSTVGSRQSAAGQSTERRTVSTEQRTPATVQRSSQAPSNRSQSTVQKSSQAPSNRTQSTVQRSSQASRGSQQPAVSSRQSSGSRQSVSQRSSSTVSRSSSAPAARSQSSSGRSSANVSSRSSRSSSRSSGTPSRSSSSSSSSGKSDNSSRSSRR